MAIADSIGDGWYIYDDSWQGMNTITTMTRRKMDSPMHTFKFIGKLRWRYRWSKIAFGFKVLWNAFCGYELTVECYECEPTNGKPCDNLADWTLHNTFHEINWCCTKHLAVVIDSKTVSVEGYNGLFRCQYDGVPKPSVKRLRMCFGCQTVVENHEIDQHKCK